MPSWSLTASDPGRALTLARALGVRPLLGELLVQRGIVDEERARRYLAPRLADLRAPLGGPGGSSGAMAGFAAAVDRLDRAIAAGETIGLFGDYDVDGVTSAALLAGYLRAAGASVVARVAHRDAGYGFGAADADHLAGAGARVVVTCDCGTSDHDAIARARARGVDVIVVDHHEVPERDPGAHALINPHQPSCRFPFKGLASVGIAFYLACALRSRLRARGAGAPDPRAWLDLVAVGTVADLAPLADENRVLVTAGLRELGERRRPGLRALLERAGVPSDRPLTAVDIGFKIAPRLNAPGRLGEARLALELLLSDEAGAGAAVDACEAANEARRAVQERVLAEALAEVEAAPASRVIVVGRAGWHPGVVGIVAAKLVDRYRRPAFVLAVEGEVARGSGRSVGGFDLVRALRRAAPIVERFGGHAAAAGVTVRRARLPELARALEDAFSDEAGIGARAALGGGGTRDGGGAVDSSVPDQRAGAGGGGAPDGDALLRADPAGARGGGLAPLEVDLDEVDEALAEEIARLAPFGVGNPEPRLVARGVSLDRVRVVAERHLQVTLSGARAAHDGIAFGLAPSPLARGDRVDAAFVPEIDVYRGSRRLRLRVVGLDAGRPLPAAPRVADVGVALASSARAVELADRPPPSP